VFNDQQLQRNMKNQIIILRISLGLLFYIVTTFPVFAGAVNFSKEILKDLSPVFVIETPPSVTNITICNNQLPYQWNNIACLTAGTYTAILTGSNGSDSTAILNLSVINIGTSITNKIICDNELPYLWNGNNYSSSGTYSVTLTSSNGCDSVPILSLTVNHTVTSSTNVSVCSNLLPYHWNGNSYPVAGIYNVTLTSSAGCDSVAALHLVVRPVSASITNKIICAGQLPYHWNGHVYASAGTYSVTLNSSNGCDSVATLNLSTNPTTTSFTTVTVCNNQLPYHWNGQVYTAAGNHPVILTGASGCDSVATLILIIKPVLQSNTNVTICNGQLPYSWNGNSYLYSGIYSVTLAGSNGCDSVATLHLSSVPVLTSTTTASVCNSELPYSWNGNNYSSSGNYTASFINASGCDSVATLALTVEMPQLVNGDVVLCEGQLPYTWNGYVFTTVGTYPINPPVFLDACHSISTFTVAIDSLHAYNAVSICNNQLPYIWHGNNYAVSGSYTVTLPSSTGGCDTLATLDLAVQPVSASTTSIGICSDQLPYSWNGHNYNASGGYTVTLVNSNGCDSLATLNLTVNPVQSSTTNTIICNAQLPYSWNGNTYVSSGIYTITLTSSGGCDSIATLNLGVQPYLTSNTNIVICNNQLPYNWNGNAYTIAGNYPVTFISSGGCDSIATLNLSVNNLMTGDTTIRICNTQLPYIWNGNTYATAGNYTILLLSTGGCDSAAILHLTVNQAVSSITNTTVCNNQLPYSWNGNSYPFAGIYTVTLTSSGGCDSLATLDLSVTNILTSTTNVTLCNSQLPYHWNGNTYANPGTYSVTMVSPGGCDSVPILSLTVVPYFTSNTNIFVCSDQVPYNWNGIGYSSSGSYTATLISNTGCDSIATLNLIVKPVATSTTIKTVCSNQLPYNWNGHSYNLAGTYTVILTATNGCDSIATLSMIVNPVTTSSTSVSICSNHLPYSWNGNIYPSVGTYHVTLTGSSGCDSLATLLLQVKQTTFSTTNISICSNQFPYTWNGQQFTTGGVHTVNLTNIAGCDSVASLNLTVNPVTTSNSNAIACVNQLPYIWNGQSYTTAGLHTVVLVNSSGCDSIATLNLVINPVQTSLTQLATCTNQLPYQWNGQSYSTAGTYTVTLTSVSGCDSLATLNLTVNPVAMSTTNVSTCSSQLPYLWNGQSYTTAGIHAVVLTSSLGCDSVATLNLSIQPTPQIPSVTSPVVYCQFDTTSVLTAGITDPSAHLVWYTDITGGIGTLSAPRPSSLIPVNINYYVSQVNGTCESPRAVISVNVNKKPMLGTDKSIRICFGSSADLSTLYATNGYNVSWTHNTLPVVNSSAITNAGTYQLIVLTSYGCADTAQVDLIIQPKVIAHAGNDADAEYNIPYQLLGSGGVTYQWAPANLLNDPFIANPLATITANSSFILMVKDEIGCTAFDTVNIRVLNGPTFYVPTAFTPNGDGLNDIFRPTPVGISSLDFFRIFNRYGELVFETSELGKGWDGIYKGVRQNTGNFVWSLKGTDRKGQVKILKGNVMLIK